jgi:hypothetical protein
LMIEEGVLKVIGKVFIELLLVFGIKKR